VNAHVHPVMRSVFAMAIGEVCRPRVTLEEFETMATKKWESTGEGRLAALRKAEALIWDLAHPEGRCIDGDLDDAAHALFHLSREIEQPGWRMPTDVPEEP
jgi:hypothetical protein